MKPYTVVIGEACDIKEENSEFHTDFILRDIERYVIFERRRELLLFCVQ